MANYEKKKVEEPEGQSSCQTKKCPDLFYIFNIFFLNLYLAPFFLFVHESNESCIGILEKKHNARYTDVLKPNILKSYFVKDFVEKRDFLPKVEIFACYFYVVLY